MSALGQQVATQHAAYFAQMMPQFLANKKPDRISDAVYWTRNYCRDVLPNLIVDRDSIKRVYDD
jgi:hypothetical protein